MFQISLSCVQHTWGLRSKVNEHMFILLISCEDSVLGLLAHVGKPMSKISHKLLKCFSQFVWASLGVRIDHLK